MASSEYGVGLEIAVPLHQMMEPMIGRIVRITLDGEEINTRIESVGVDGYATVKVVPDSVRE